MTFYDHTLYGRDDEMDEFGDSGAFSESLEEELEEEDEEERRRQEEEDDWDEDDFKLPRSPPL